MRSISVDVLPPVSVIGLGTIRFGEKSFDPKLATDIILRALELGITHFDTALAYGFGRSETILGEALKGRDLSKIVVTSKGLPLLPTGGAVMRQALASRKRLGIPAISLYLLHAPLPLASKRVIMGGYANVARQGVAATIGVSNHSLRQWKDAERAARHPVLANEVLFNLLHPKALDDIVPWANGEKKLVIAASPLALGMLSGRYDAAHPPSAIRGFRKIGLRHAAFPPSADNLTRVGPLIEELRAVANRHGVTPAAIALAWAVHREPMVVIPSASSIAQLEENAAAGSVTLSEEEAERLAASAKECGP